MAERAKSITLRDRRPRSPAGPTMAAGVARGLFDFAVAKGAERTALARRSGLDPADLQEPDRRVALTDYVALMHAGQALSGDPALALRFGEEVDLSEVSIVGLLTRSSRTMLDAFGQIARYSRLVLEVGGPDGGPRFRLEPASAGLLWLTDGRDNPNAFPEATETTLAWLVCGARRYSDAAFCKAVHVTHAAPSYAREYERVFRAPVAFASDRNALLIDAAWVTAEVAPRQRYAFGVLSEHAEALLASLERSTSLRARVESLLMPVLHTGEIGMETIAERLALSRQTLLRRLKAEGVTFETTLDALRHKLALHYLEGRRTSVNETAYLLGFSTPAAFSRAFKRWTGHGPGRLRAR
jgi:AraC-like DNA-binding protein